MPSHKVKFSCEDGCLTPCVLLAAGPAIRREDGSSNGGSADLSRSDEAATPQLSKGSESSITPVEEVQQPQEKGRDPLEIPAPPEKESMTWWGYITGADRATPVKRSR